MNPIRVFGSLLVLLGLLQAGVALAGSDRLNISRAEESTLHGAPITAKALGDTIYLLGDPTNPDQYSNGVGPQANGTFEDPSGNPGWFGWTHEDATYSPDQFWHVSDFQAVSGNYSMWCGTYFDGDPGYGNDWSQNLVFSYQVDDNSVACIVNLVCTLQHDSEPGYDYTYVEYNRGGVWVIWNAGFYDGRDVIRVNESTLFQPADYVGSGDDQIQLRIRFDSDGVWSDEDGLWDTDGACRVDDITVSVNGAVVDSEDFEDGSSARWIPTVDPGVGDYAALYIGLQDLDPCVSNNSPQVAFIDDGVVVPGTGGTPCTTWCYGPGGFIVNNTGGLMGPDHGIDNLIISPYLAWPENGAGADLTFGVYRHEELGSFHVWPGIFYQWHVRSTTGDPGDLTNAQWRNRHFVHYGGPDYIRHHEIVTDLIEPGATYVQVALKVIEYNVGWHPQGTDGTPAPYFDNVQLRVYPFAGPAIAARSIDLFNDGFPAAGDLDFDNLAGNAVRLDAARNVAAADDLVNDPGDSIVVAILAVRAGSVLDDMPKLHVRMLANPLFDGVRVLPPNFSQDGNVVTGWVYGDSTYNASGGLIADRYNFDLPDDDFFFPGDVLRYYIEARDNLAGDIGVALIPADTAGFAQRNGPIYSALRYHRDFEVRALPTVFSATTGDQPRILFWQDSIDNGGFNEWLHALGHGGRIMGHEFDLYVTNGPSSGVGNGLGGRATGALLSGYETLLYSSATLSVNLLANGDFDNDPSDDIQVVSDWLAQGGKHAFLTGDDLVTGLLDAGPQGQAFVNQFFNVNYVDRSVRDYIGNQTAPRVAAVPGNGMIATVSEWIAYGGCPGINTFDAIEAGTGTVRLAEFTDPAGNPGAYTYTAASYYYNSAHDAEVVMLPYDLMHLHNAAGWQPPAGYAGIPARSIILDDILLGFGHGADHPAVGVAPDAPLTARSFPNPFNPNTTIRLTLPRAGDVSLKVFNVRGERVRTLVDERLEAGVHDIGWDGRSDAGRQVASGVYFYETRTVGEILVDKMTLVR